MITQAAGSPVPKSSNGVGLVGTTGDEALIAAIAAGDAAAMRTLYNRHRVRVFRFAVRLVDDAAFAEDIVSEAFIEVWRQADRFEGRSSVSTWIMSIARFKALSVRRRRQETELDEKLAETVGLIGKMTETIEGPMFLQLMPAVLDRYGPYPHPALRPVRELDRKSPGSRLIRARCLGCGYTIRVTQRWLNVAVPNCPNSRKAAARRCLRWRRSSAGSSNFGNLGGTRSDAIVRS